MNNKIEIKCQNGVDVGIFNTDINVIHRVFYKNSDRIDSVFCGILVTLNSWGVRAYDCLHNVWLYVKTADIISLEPYPQYCKNCHRQNEPIENTNEEFNNGKSV